MWHGPSESIPARIERTRIKTIQTALPRSLADRYGEVVDSSKEKYETLRKRSWLLRVTVVATKRTNREILDKLFLSNEERRRRNDEPHNVETQETAKARRRRGWAVEENNSVPACVVCVDRGGSTSEGGAAAREEGARGGAEQRPPGCTERWRPGGGGARGRTALWPLCGLGSGFRRNETLLYCVCVDSLPLLVPRNNKAPYHGLPPARGAHGPGSESGSLAFVTLLTRLRFRLDARRTKEIYLVVFQRYISPASPSSRLPPQNERNLVVSSHRKGCRSR
jgi:hypothetical protein